MSYSQMPPPPYAAYAVPVPAPARSNNGLAIAGFVLGLLGVLGSFIPLLNIGAMVIGLVGAVLAAVGLGRARTLGTGKGLAVAGLVLGVLSLVIGVLVNVLFVSAVDEAADEVTSTSVDAPSGSGGGEAHAEDLGATRDNPAPIGSAITGGDWTVTVNSVTTAAEDALGQTPQAGSTLLVVNMTATYNGTDSQGSSSWATVDFVTADGTTISGLDGSTLFVADQPFDSMTTLYQGASVTGDELIEVPSNGWQDGVLAVSPDVFSDSTFVAMK